jgi:hypothetical protein
MKLKKDSRRLGIKTCKSIAVQIGFFDDTK